MHIESRIPAPTRDGRGRPPKYPFGKMEVGDSVFFEGANTSPGSTGGNEYRAAQAYGRLHGLKFSGRTESAGLRIWRIE